MGLFGASKQYNPMKTVRQGKRIALRQVRQSVTRDHSERGSAAWHRFDMAGDAIKTQRREQRRSR